MKGAAYISVVLFAYGSVFIAELAYSTHFYYLICSLFFAFSCVYASCIASITRSKLILSYASVLFVAAIFNSYLQIPSVYYTLSDIYYYAPLNYCLIMQALESVIIIRGGIDVICSLLSLHRRNSSSSDSINACMGSSL